MSSYQMSDGTVVMTEKALQKWEGKTLGAAGTRETLYRSQKGRFYIEKTSELAKGFRPSARYITEKKATAWLIVNGHELPAELAALGPEVEE